jgi:hypothetical protein
MAAEAAVLIAAFARPWLARAAVEMPAFVLGRSALSTVAAWLACAVLVLGAYRLAERQFTRMEIPAKPLKFTLVDWMRQEG